MLKTSKLEAIEMALGECCKAAALIGDDLLVYIIDMAILQAKKRAVESLAEACSQSLATPRREKLRPVAAE